MKLTKIIVASDKNPMYYDFWKPLSKIWSNFGFEPILFLISDRDTDFYKNESGLVKELKKIDGVDTGFQSQIVRLFAHKFLGDDICLISDIDMLPLQKSYFISNTLPYNDTDIVIFSSDAYDGVSRYPMCYIASKACIMVKCLGIENITFSEFTEQLLALNLKWDTDELFMSSKLNEYNHIVKLKRGWSNGIANNRIDRVIWNYNIQNLHNGEYIDSHSLRPLTKYKNEIQTLINNINYEK